HRPPHSASMVFDNLSHSRVSDCQISCFNASPSSPSKRALDIWRNDTAPAPEGSASRRAYVLQPASHTVAEVNSTMSQAWRNDDRLFPPFCPLVSKRFCSEEGRGVVIVPS